MIWWLSFFIATGLICLYIGTTIEKALDKIEVTPPPPKPEMIPMMGLAAQIEKDMFEPKKFGNEINSDTLSAAIYQEVTATKLSNCVEDWPDVVEKCANCECKPKKKVKKKVTKTKKKVKKVSKIAM